MESEWNILLKKVMEKENDAPSWVSDKASLIQIIEWANGNGIDPVGVSSIDNTKLRTIIKEVRKAIDRNDTARVSELFQWAKEYTILKLRPMVGITQPENIPVFSSIEDNKQWYTIKLSPEQYERIKKSTIPHYSYFVLGKEIKETSTGETPFSTKKGNE